MDKLKEILDYIYSPPFFLYLTFMISFSFGSFMLSKNLFIALETSGIKLNKEARKKWGNFFYFFLMSIFVLHLSLVLFVMSGFRK